MLYYSLEIEKEAATATSRFTGFEGAASAGAGRGVDSVLRRIARTGDETTADHLKRVGRFALLIAGHLGLSETLQARIYVASQLHDIGKLAIPQEIVRKIGSFTRAERTIMNRHTLLGGEMLSERECPYLDTAAEVALFHHERWDGSGYPYGLSGNAIPLSARIVAICDVYDALRSRRPYKDSYSHDTALRAIRDGDGWTKPSHFDPRVLYAFLSLNMWFDEIYTGSLDA
jgi:putative two-component system response regulator